MPIAKPLVAFFKNINKHDIALVGGKGANLGEMWEAGFPVPNGFAVTTTSYDLFLEKSDLKKKIEDILRTTDVNQPDQLADASKRIQKAIKVSEIPSEVIHEVTKSYKKLSGFLGNTLTAVRSSATAEDLPGMSFAGQQETFLNIKGTNNVLFAIRDCWASLFTARAIFYRAQNKISTEKVKISVIIQKMIQSEVSGVMFTVDPVTGEKDRIIIEAIWGLGEMIVQGSVVPDHYVVQKDTFITLSKEIADQMVQLVRKKEKTEIEKVPWKKIAEQKLTDSEIGKLAKIAQKLQEHYYFPQDVEWAKDKDGNLFIVQTRPVTTFGQSKTEKKKAKIEGNEFTVSEAPILMGAAASPGIGSGPVVILTSPKEISKVKSGDILVAPMTSPDYVPAMKKAKAIITDEGGVTSHAAIVSRELGIPCVTGTKNGTRILKNETVVTVDGSRGQVFLGGKVIHQEKTSKEEIIKTKTATKLYVNLAEKELATKVAEENVEGVGLLRAEFMIANIGIHPKEAIKNKKQMDFIDKLASGLTTFCKAFYPRPVVYRATDFKTNEYRSLPGGAKWEPEEANPMLGFRGAYRYVANPEVFNLELQAIKKVRRDYNNLWLMIPFVRSPLELKRVRRIVAAEGLFEATSFKFWMMVEIPVNVIQIEDFLEIGVDGVSIGSNDLTMLTTGTDRDNAEVADAFDERSKAVLWSIRRVVKACHKHSVTVSICGQAPSTYPDLVTKLVKYGITSISVNPDAINKTRKAIMDAEKEVAGG